MQVASVTHLSPPTSARALVTPGSMHRLGLAVRDSAAAAEWFQRILGATPFPSGAVIPHEEQTPTPGPTAQEQDGADSRMLWHGGHLLLLLAPLGDDGYISRFLHRWGTGLHSLAWEIEDMWSADQRLRSRGLRITGVNIPGRHFFLHPGDAHGLLLELTDTWFVNDPRRGGPEPAEGGGVVQDATVAWVTAVVSDVGASAELLSEIAGATAVEGNPRRSASIETTRDVLIGDLTVRLVSPRSEQSRYGEVLAGGPRLFSYTLRVPDLGQALTALEREGIVVADRDGDLARTDPTTTLGVPIEWVG